MFCRLTLFNKGLKDETKDRYLKKILTVKGTLIRWQTRNLL